MPTKTLVAPPSGPSGQRRDAGAPCREARARRAGDRRGGAIPADSGARLRPVGTGRPGGDAARERFWCEAEAEITASHASDE
jgi:hypothetical protein